MNVKQKVANNHYRNPIWWEGSAVSGNYYDHSIKGQWMLSSAEEGNEKQKQIDEQYKRDVLEECGLIPGQNNSDAIYALAQEIVSKIEFTNYYGDDLDQTEGEVPEIYFIKKMLEVFG